MKGIAVSAALAVTLPTQAIAGERWCPVPGSAYAYKIEFTGRGYITRSKFLTRRCKWTNAERSAADCDGAPYRVLMKRDGDRLLFVDWDEQFGVTAGPQPFVRC